MIFVVSIFTFLMMEIVAWAMHKYVMHGFLWTIHADHHHHSSSKHSIFEQNDLFFIFFSLLAIGSFTIWNSLNWSPFLGIGIGISFYGATYFLVHDIFIHQRIKIFRHAGNNYFKAIRYAHKIHHKQRSKKGARCFGMLWVPKRYYHRSKSLYTTSRSRSTRPL